MTVPSLRSLFPAIVAIATICVPLRAAQAEPDAWDVTIAVRVFDAGDKPVELHVAFPPENDRQRISDVTVRARGLKSDVVHGAEPEVVFRGRVPEARRISVGFRVDRTPFRTSVPSVQPVPDPPVATLDALRPAPLYPSRSILVREFLETHVAPRLEVGDEDMLRAIYSAIRDELPYDRSGKSLPLDVLRRGHGLRIGRERVLTASLRSAGIPAHFVEGIDLSSSTKRKRRFWNEVWADGHWYPVSVSGGWLGKLPDDYIAVVTDGRRVVRSAGAGSFEYTVVVQPVASGTPAVTPSPAGVAESAAP